MMTSRVTVKVWGVAGTMVGEERGELSIRVC